MLLDGCWQGSEWGFPRASSTFMRGDSCEALAAVVLGAGKPSAKLLRTMQHLARWRIAYQMAIVPSGWMILEISKALCFCAWRSFSPMLQHSHHQRQRYPLNSLRLTLQHQGCEGN